MIVAIVRVVVIVIVRAATLAIVSVVLHGLFELKWRW